MFPGVWVYVSQIDSPLPSSSHAPSIWYEAVARPQRNPSGKRRDSVATVLTLRTPNARVDAGRMRIIAACFPLVPLGKGSESQSV